MIKQMISELNAAMRNGEISFYCVKRIMKQIGVLTGIDYCIINKRVCFTDEYGKLHDAWIEA